MLAPPGGAAEHPLPQAWKGPLPLVKRRPPRQWRGGGPCARRGARQDTGESGRLAGKREDPAAPAIWPDRKVFSYCVFSYCVHICTHFENILTRPDCWRKVVRSSRASAPAKVRAMRLYDFGYGRALRQGTLGRVTAAAAISVVAEFGHARRAGRQLSRYGYIQAALRQAWTKEQIGRPTRACRPRTTRWLQPKRSSAREPFLSRRVCITMMYDAEGGGRW